jgi:hypothetical protein
MIKDEREKVKDGRSLFAEKDLTDKIDTFIGERR